MIQTYYNENYYYKGLVARSEIQGNRGELYVVTRNNYDLYDVTAATELDNSYEGRYLTERIFPKLVQTDKDFYEGLVPAPGSLPSTGNPEDEFYPDGNKRTFVAYEYDDYGNVDDYRDGGDWTDATDDVEAVITYTYTTDPFLYIVDKPIEITVIGNGQLLRKRTGHYDSAGNLDIQSEYLADSTPATTTFAYTTYGMLNFLQGPPNQNGDSYKIWYYYDPLTHTHITKVHDVFEYESTAEYDLKYGKPTKNTDTNGQVTSYDYDQFGRTIRITGPYQGMGGR